MLPTTSADTLGQQTAYSGLRQAVDLLPLIDTDAARFFDFHVIITPQDSEAFMSLLGDGDQRGILIIYAAQPEPGGLASTIGWMFNDEIWWRSVVDGSYRDWVTEHYASS